MESINCFTFLIVIFFSTLSNCFSFRFTTTTDIIPSLNKKYTVANAIRNSPLQSDLIGNSPRFLNLSSIGWGVLSLDGEDRCKIMQSLSTNLFDKLNYGDVVETCFLNSKGKLNYFASSFIMADNILLICESNVTSNLMKHLDKYIFPLDRVKVKDVTSMYTVLLEESVGTASFTPKELLSSLLIYDNELNGEDGGSSIKLTRKRFCNWSNKIYIDGNGMVLINSSAVPALQYVSKGINGTSEEDISRRWKEIRIELGIPGYGHEIPSSSSSPVQYSPLEAGLMRTVDFRKGCFTGQEIVSKLALTNNIRHRLCRLRLTCTVPVLTDADVKEGDKIFSAVSNTDMDEEIGVITSAVTSRYACTTSTGSTRTHVTECLAYLRKSFWTDKAIVYIEYSTHSTVSSTSRVPAEVQVEDLLLHAFISYDIADSPAPPVLAVPVPVSVRVPTVHDDDDAVMTRKEAKLKEMAKKLEAFKKKPAN